jgi:DMSO reductase anchor subunit
MTTLLQAATGSLIFALLFHAARPTLLLVLFAITALALNISVFHLGRPAYAWRALKMWRRSWLSREVLLFGLFFSALTCLTIATCVDALPMSWLIRMHAAGIQPLQRMPATTLALAASGILTAVLGIGGVVASAFIYLVPARPSWNMLHTPVDFLLSAALIGTILPTILGSTFAATWTGHYPLWPCIVATALWIANQGLRILRLQRSKIFEHRASTTLLNLPGQRTALIGSFVLAASAPAFVASGNAMPACLAAFGAVLMARYLFFVSVVPLNMALTFTRGGTH